MKIFLTGATGYIGSAVLDALVRGGHDVTALVRNGERAAQVSARGARAVVGDLGVPKSYLDAAVRQDGYIHTAADAAARVADIDRGTLDTLIPLARSSASSFFIYTSGIWVVGDTRQPAAEDAPLNPAALVAWRPAHEQAVIQANGGGLRTMVVRPGIVYGGSRGIIGDMFRDAANGLMRVVGAGDNHWPLIYDRDLGDLYARLAVHPDASGIYHANDEGDERVNDIVAAIAPYLPVRPDVRHVPIDEARAKMGSYADALSLDQVVRSPRARAMGWTPSLRSVAGNAARLLEEWRAVRN